MLTKPFSLVLANSRIAFQSSVPKRMAQTDINIISARIWVVFWGSRGSVSVLNFENRAFADIGALKTEKKQVFCSFLGCLSVQKTLMFLPWGFSSGRVFSKFSTQESRMKIKQDNAPSISTIKRANLYYVDTSTRQGLPGKQQHCRKAKLLLCFLDSGF